MQIAEYGFSPPPVFKDDSAFVARIASAYRRSVDEFAGHGTSFWGLFEEKHAAFKQAFESHDNAALGRLLRSPAETELFYGFDLLNAVHVRQLTEAELLRTQHAASYYKSLIIVAIAMGAIRCPYPEANQEFPNPPIEDLLTEMDEALGFRLDFPNPFESEFGLKTSRGIASYRSIQAIYQAWRAAELAKFVAGKRILEIGAGLGRNAYYARKLGLDYTIVDIPNTQMAQASFLGRVLGEDALSLNGEADRFQGQSKVRLRSPEWLRRTHESFDVALNVDSLTEMDSEHALAYVRFGRDRARAFLSINHEFNPFRACDIMRKAQMSPIMRTIHSPREGYVEELYLRAPRWIDRLRRFFGR